MAPVELTLALTPRSRFDLIDVRAFAEDVHGGALDGFRRRLYVSRHTTAGFLPQGLAARLTTRPEAIKSYLDLFRAMFPEGAGYRHDQLELREELAPEQRAAEPTNGDAHLLFIGGGLKSCVSYDARRSCPAPLVELDGTYKGTPRKREATIVGYNDEVEVARTTLRVPVSTHPIEAVNLKQPTLGFYEEITSLIARHGVTKGRVRLELPASEQAASLTVNEYETLLMQHDLAEVLRNPLRFAAEKARHAWDDPGAVPAKALGYAKYDLVHAMNRLVDVLGLQTSRIERLIARALEVPASRFLRMRRSVDLLISDKAIPGQGRLVEGTYQAPILVQWRPAEATTREVQVAITQLH